jgi:hypothetical protein
MKKGYAMESKKAKAKKGSDGVLEYWSIGVLGL